MHAEYEGEENHLFPSRGHSLSELIVFTQFEEIQKTHDTMGKLLHKTKG